MIVQFLAQAFSWAATAFDRMHFWWEVETPKSEKWAYRFLAVALLLFAKGYSDWRVGDRNLFWNAYNLFALPIAAIAAGIFIGRQVGE